MSNEYLPTTSKDLHALAREIKDKSDQLEKTGDLSAALAAEEEATVIKFLAVQTEIIEGLNSANPKVREIAKRRADIMKYCTYLNATTPPDPGDIRAVALDQWGRKIRLG